MDAATPPRTDEQLLAWTSEHRLLFTDTVDALGEAHAGDRTLCLGRGAAPAAQRHLRAR